MERIVLVTRNGMKFYKISVLRFHVWCWFRGFLLSMTRFWLSQGLDDHSGGKLTINCRPSWWFSDKEIEFYQVGVELKQSYRLPCRVIPYQWVKASLCRSHSPLRHSMRWNILFLRNLSKSSPHLIFCLPGFLSY